MNIYELVNDINTKHHEQHWDFFQLAFDRTNRAKLTDTDDLEIYDLFSEAYKVSINYRPDQRDGDIKKEYQKNGDKELTPFTEVELAVFNSLDWTNLPHNLTAHIHDVIWLSNHKHESAETAAEEYFKSYREWFDEENWVQCVDYINRAVELAAKLGRSDLKDNYLTEVYNDIIKLKGEDSSFLSISLIQLLIVQNSNSDFKTLIPFADRLITKNEGSLSTSHVLEQAYQIKAELYKKLKDAKSADKTYIQYADVLIQEAEKLVDTPKNKSSIDNRNWFMAENDIKKAIGIFQNHGAPERADNAQKRLVEIQKMAIKHMPMQEIKIDVSKYFNKICTEFETHSLQELIWDVVFTFGFQNKQKIRENVTKSPSISSMFSMQMLGSEGQTEFFLPGLDLRDEDNILQHMYHKAREYEEILGQTVGFWFIKTFRNLNLQESDLDSIFENNPIIPKGQEKDVQRGVYYGLTGHMSDALDKLAPKTENIIRNLAEMCGDITTYYDAKEGVQQKKVISQVFIGNNLNECIEENILFTLDGLLQQKAGSNIRNRIGHGLFTEAECSTGDCIYFVMIVLKLCAMYSKSFVEEFEKRRSK